MQLPAPFGKYELLERIATGGMAEVFLARSFGVAGFEKRLVIKRILAEHARDPRFVAGFIHEAKIGVYLNHPNIVQVYDLGKVGNTWYIAMEHLHGRDLTRLVKTLRAGELRLPVPVAVAIVAEACRGLAYAHGRTDAEGRRLGFVHRDVSPHNLMVTFDGEVKLVDFGVARLINTTLGHAPSRAPGHPGGGKYAYMSPEQARGEEIDHRTDIFSIGIVLWELLAGHRLFQDPDPAEKLRKVIDAQVLDPRAEGADIDDGLWAILKKALARDRDERYPWASLLEEDLRAWLFQKGAPAGSTDIAREMARAFPEEARRSTSLDLSRLVADVERLDIHEPTASELTPGGTHTPMPGRLRVPQGECKKVTALVVDVDGLTPLATRLEPEDLFRRHYRLLRWMRRIADRYGGVVWRSQDDEAVLLFGVPRTHADDLSRALECALELQRSAPSLVSKGLSVRLAIGAHTGEVVVRSAGGGARYTPRGDTVRLAQRLSMMSDGGQVLVSDRALLAAENAFRLKRGPDLPVRTGAEVEPSYVLEGRRRGLRVAGRGPWLRRGTELEVLRDAVADLAQGRGAALFLLGEPGSGKSRLVQELRDAAQRRGLPFYAGRSKPWGADPPMEAFRDLVRALIGVEPDGTRQQLADRVPRLAQLGLAEHEVEVLAALAGTSDRTPGAEPTLRALGRALDGLAREGPVIVALEDLHLVGQSEREGVANLVRNTVRRPVLLLVTLRGRLPQSFEGLGTVVELGGFSAEAQRRMFAYLLEAEEVEDDLFRLVERTCEGNPLYIEEMARYLLYQEQVALRDGVAHLVGDPEGLGMPDTIAGLLSARLDALDPASKGALQLAAVMGLTFSQALLGRAAGVDDPTPLVTDLQSHGLVVRATPGSGGDSWSFASELVRQSTLRGILGVQRRDYHRMVAQAIEAQHADDADAWAATLAWHCAEGGRMLDAARYAYRSGELLEHSRFLERARLEYQRGLKWIAEVPDETETWEARVQGEAMLHFRTGVVSMLLGDLRTGERALQLALDIASDAGVPWVEVRSHVELGRAYLHNGRPRMASAHLAQARSLLALEHDKELELAALEATAILAHEEGRNADAEALWNDALALAEGDSGATARCLVGLANRYLRSGETERAAPLLERALEAATKAGDRILEGRVLNNIGLLELADRDYDRALAYFRDALRVREGIGYTQGAMVNHHNIGDAHFARGDLARAYVAFERSRALAVEIGWERGLALNDVYLGYIEAVRGGGESGIAKIDRAIESARRLGDAEIATTGALLAGRWMIEHGRPDEGRAHLLRALEDARRFDLRPMAREIEGLLVEPATPAGAPPRAEAERP